MVDKTGEKPRRLETPQFFWMRVAMGIFAHEDNPEDQIISLSTTFTRAGGFVPPPLRFSTPEPCTPSYLPATCTRWTIPLSRSCTGELQKMHFLSKWAGGLGGSWTAVRGTGSHIAGTNGESQGVIPFLKMHNDQLCAVNPGAESARVPDVHTLKPGTATSLNF